MRIHLKLTKNKEIVPFDYQHLLTGNIHKWIGRNKIHNEISLFSFSQLQNGKPLNNGLDFPNGSSWFISSWDNDIFKKIIKSIQKNPDLFYGMEVREIILQENPNLSDKTNFQIASPVFIKRNIEGKTKFFFYKDKESAQLLKETLLHKMEKAGLPIDNSLDIEFDLSYLKKCTKKFNYKKGKHVIENIASWCPVIIQGKPETKVFAWNVGVGNSTGIGFGALK